MTHYLVGSEAVDGKVEHISAETQEEAVKAYVSGENQYGYSADFFEDYDIHIVAASKVSEYHIEIMPPTKEQVAVVKVKK